MRAWGEEELHTCERWQTANLSVYMGFQLETPVTRQMTIEL